MGEEGTREGWGGAGGDPDTSVTITCQKPSRGTTLWAWVPNHRLTHGLQTFSIDQLWIFILTWDMGVVMITHHRRRLSTSDFCSQQCEESCDSWSMKRFIIRCRERIYLKLIKVDMESVP